MTVKVRFAPSPTGYLHVGNCRTALINWLFAKRHSGVFLLRFDDTDTARSEKKYEEAILEDLAWLGLTHDEVASQSLRAEAYKAATQKLMAMGRLYPCFETPEDLAFKRKRQMSQGHPPLYDRAGLHLTEEQKAEYVKKGVQPHFRFLIEDKPITWNDLVRGPVAFEGRNLSDPILVREDGQPVYTLASVVDDIDFNITHIIRAEDHVANTAIQLQLFEALGKDVSTLHFAHPPLISGEEGEGLSKRLGSLSIRELRQANILPQALLDLLGRLGTSLPIEPLTTSEPLIASFDFKNFARSTPKFAFSELENLNRKILQTLSYDEAKPYLENFPFVDAVFWDKVKLNLSKLDDLEMWHRITKGTITPEVGSEDREFLKIARDALPESGWEDDPWALWMETLKPQTDRRGKTLFMPLRLALTGESHGPELSAVLKLMGRDKAKERLSH